MLIVRLRFPVAKGGCSGSSECDCARPRRCPTRLDALLYLSQAEPPIKDAGDGWDSDPMLLFVPNGVIDLRAGELRPGHREDRITMSATVPFDPQARCPRSERFLAEVFAGDAELITCVHEDANIKLGSVLSDVFGASGQRMLHALVTERQVDIDQVARLAHWTSGRWTATSPTTMALLCRCLWTA